MKLSDTKIRAAKAQQKPYKLFDGGGLYINVMANGSRLWRLKYRFSGKEKTLSLGVYPHITLQSARAKRDEAKRALAEGVDPGAERRAAKAVQPDTFQRVAEEWLALQEKKLAAVTLAKAGWLLSFVLSKLGERVMNEITAPEILMALRSVESRGTHETATRVKQRISQIYRFAIATGRAERDPTADLRGALAPVVVKNHAAITEPAKVAELLRAIDGYMGQPASRAALRLAPLVFVRPGELRTAEWSEFELEGAEPTWRIPAPRMKMREPHVVPLSCQAVAILRELQPMTGRGTLVFPSIRSSARPLSENTLNAALRRIGYSNEEMTAHGFRTLASTLLNEQGWHPDLIELQLAHAERNKVRAAYNKAQRLAERRKMMQAWADYLDTLKSGGNVVPIRRSQPAA